MEYLRENIGNQLSSNDESEERICPYCGQSCKTVFVHGHEQCVCCKMNIKPCCEGGEILEKEKERMIGNQNITRRLRDTYPIMIGVCKGEFLKEIRLDEVGKLY